MSSATNKIVHRRRFLQSSAAILAAPAFVPQYAFGANDRINVGMIGIGKMGEGHLNHLLGRSEVQVTAVCDVYKMFRVLGVDRTNARYAKNKNQANYQACTGYNDFRDLIARKDIDAVLIATPDHWHAIPVIEAARAGKDIYCEKPLSLTVREAYLMLDTVRKYNIVFQTGSQQRSSSNFRFGCELVRNGYIGQLKTVHVGIGGPSKPCDLPGEPIPEGLDWDMWLGQAPYRPFNAVLRPPHNKTFPNWRSYRDYSGGGMTDWGAHHFDIAQWGMGADEIGVGPVRITPPNGSDIKNLTYEYADGVVMYHGSQGGVNPNGVRFTGTEGAIEVNRGHIKSWPDKLTRTALKPSDIHLYESRSHHQNWFDCIRSRKRPICDIEIGASTIITCHLGNIAFWLGRELKWNPQKREFVNDAGANRLLDRARREPWVI